MIAAATASIPEPPNCSGTVTPSSPSSRPQRRNRSRLKRSSRSCSAACPSSSPSANARTISRSVLCSTLGLNRSVIVPSPSTIDRLALPCCKRWSLPPRLSPWHLPPPDARAIAAGRGKALASLTTSSWIKPCSIAAVSLEPSKCGANASWKVVASMPLVTPVLATSRQSRCRSPCSSRTPHVAGSRLAPILRRGRERREQAESREQREGEIAPTFFWPRRRWEMHGGRDHNKRVAGSRGPDSGSGGVLRAAARRLPGRDEHLPRRRADGWRRGRYRRSSSPTGRGVVGHRRRRRATAGAAGPM